jgi:hypothetical protein
MSTNKECGCCAGRDAEVPVIVKNQPDLPKIEYRGGQHGSFKETMLARLSSTSLPALGDLSTRSDDDFTIALCDAHAMMLDVLSFYQERIANENFLRTASERGSVLELARLIGYQLAPGVAASAYLSFTLQESPGAVEHNVEPVKIPIGTRVQSVPGPDEKPQSFETIEEIIGRAEWNAIPVQTTERHLPEPDDKEMYLAGINTRLQPGDVILIVGADRERNLGSERWDVRLLQTVESDSLSNRTRVIWKEGLGDSQGRTLPADEPIHVFAFRQRAALFGHNAPDPRVFSTQNNSISTRFKDSDAQKGWANFGIQSDQIDLDGSFPKIIAGSWIALVTAAVAHQLSSLPGYIELYRVSSVQSLSRTDYGLTGKITRIIPDIVEHLDIFSPHLQETLVLAETEELFIADRPLNYPLYSDTVALAHHDESLAARQVISISGKRARIAIADSGNGLELKDADDKQTTLAILKSGDELLLVEPPEQSVGSSFEAVSPQKFGSLIVTGSTIRLRLHLEDRNGCIGIVTSEAANFSLSPARKTDQSVSEVAFISSSFDAVNSDRDRTTIKLSQALKNCYDRATVSINANVARATHGESIVEILGSGSALSTNQKFKLRQSPVTYVSAETPSGRASTLEVRINDVLWQEVPSLYGRGPTEHVYTTSFDDTAHTTVAFGDGIEGARLPSGQDNVRSRYRKGIGVAGNLAAGRLTNLLSRPLGVTGANNPEAASGGEDPESLSDARRNAPLTVLTLDRAVSIQDYEDYARSFAGIAKSYAVWIPSGPGRGVFLTVAGSDDSRITEGSRTHEKLVRSLRSFGDPLVPITVKPYQPVLFRIKAAIKIAPNRETDRVLRDAKLTLFKAFSFVERNFGQVVSIDEVSSILQAVSGVEAARIIYLYQVGKEATLETRLFPALPVVSLTQAPSSAELLIIDEEGSTVEVFV